MFEWMNVCMREFLVKLMPRLTSAMPSCHATTRFLYTLTFYLLWNECSSRIASLFVAFASIQHVLKLLIMGVHIFWISSCSQLCFAVVFMQVLFISASHFLRQMAEVFAMVFLITWCSVTGILLQWCNVPSADSALLRLRSPFSPTRDDSRATTIIQVKFILNLDFCSSVDLNSWGDWSLYMTQKFLLNNSVVFDLMPEGLGFLSPSNRSWWNLILMAEYMLHCG